VCVCTCNGTAVGTLSDSMHSMGRQGVWALAIA
jgi:hypothetical protein